MLILISTTSSVLDGLLYLDPGSGSFLLQLLAAGAMGGLLLVKVYWRKIRSLFKKDKPASSDEDEE